MTPITLMGLLALAVSFAYPIWFGYIYVPFGKHDQPGKRARSEKAWDAIPPDSVAFVLAFEHLGQQGKVIVPGKANECLAGWLEAHQDRLSRVLTQKAVSDALIWTGKAVPGALEDECLLGDGTPVVQMHRHDPGTPVRTLEALRCALDRFDHPPDSVVLVAHDKQYERAFNDLASLYPHHRIVNPRIVHVPYKDDFLLNPLCWAFRELYMARPADFLRRRLGTARCPDKVRLGKIE
jgi:hypothetical protein